MAFPSFKSWRLLYPSARQNMPTGTIVTWPFLSDSGVRSTGGTHVLTDQESVTALEGKLWNLILNLTCSVSHVLYACIYHQLKREKAELELENNQHYILSHNFLSIFHFLNSCIHGSLSPEYLPFLVILSCFLLLLLFWCIYTFLKPMRAGSGGRVLARIMWPNWLSLFNV